MIEYNEKSLANAKTLRHQMTPWERKLWNLYLKNLPLHIYKQKPIGKYIADFYCPKAKLVIELDGSQHFYENNILKDDDRTKYFNSLQISVVRYSNSDIDKYFNEVCEDLWNKLNKFFYKKQ